MLTCSCRVRPSAQAARVSRACEAIFVCFGEDVRRVDVVDGPVSPNLCEMGLFGKAAGVISQTAHLRTGDDDALGAYCRAIAGAGSRQDRRGAACELEAIRTPARRSPTYSGPGDSECPRITLSSGSPLGAADRNAV